MPEDYKLQLNFLPIIGELPDFNIYRKLRGVGQQARLDDDDIHAYTLPKTRENPEDRASYLVSIKAQAGYEPLIVKPSDNNDLTRWMLFKSVGDKCVSKLPRNDFVITKGGFLREIHFNMKVFPEGIEQLIIQPYYLRALKKFGFLADFHFRLATDVAFSKRVQQLSLSLDKNFRRNLDCYVDRFTKITEFLKKRWEVLSPITLPSAAYQVNLGQDFECLVADRLQSRIFDFGNGRESKSQYAGLAQFGPLKRLSEEPNILFVFQEKDRQAARDLAIALRGSRDRKRFNFPGFEGLFKTPLKIDGNPMVLPDFSMSSMKAALERARQSQGLTLPVLIVPDDDAEAYLNYKATFTNAGIPSQVCTSGVIQDENTLKWSVANIALQIFCKTGGLPWKVRTTGERCLIVGISQSHKLRKEPRGNSVEKYFAFSVLTDSSGLFQSIQVLGQGDDETTYLDALKANLRKVIQSGTDDFSRVVIHTSFKLKHTEIGAIQNVVQEAAQSVERCNRKFAVVKVNHKSRFFGANRAVNSLVPYEGTRVRLGHGEYLVWFEGIFPDKPTVTKAFPGPTHLQELQ